MLGAKPAPLLAHRLIWSVLVGFPPETLHHRCEVKCCVNPAHLEGLSPKEHREQHLRDTCKRGHPWTEENTYRRPDTGTRQCRTCAAEKSRRLRQENPEAHDRARAGRRRKAKGWAKRPGSRY